MTDSLLDALTLLDSQLLESGAPVSGHLRPGLEPVVARAPRRGRREPAPRPGGVVVAVTAAYASGLVTPDDLVLDVHHLPPESRGLLY